MQAVIITLEPIAGSRPIFISSMGMATPMQAASTRLSVMAATITAPSAQL